MQTTDPARQEILEPPRPPNTLTHWLIAAGPLVLLAMILLPAWSQSGTDYVPDVLGQMVGPLLLPALGMLYVLQRRRLDLSVWVTFGLGSAAGALLLEAHASAPIAAAGAIGIGLGVGLLNAFLVAALRLPTWPTTLAVATLGVSLHQFLTGGNELATHRSCQLLDWASVSQPILLAGLAFIGTLLLAMFCSGERAMRKDDRLALAATLVLSGVLSAWGGFCWLAYAGTAPAHVVPIGDLRVLAAAVLCGAVVLRGQGQAMVAAILLPLSLLLATIWRQMVWDLPDVSWHPTVGLLAIMVLAVQWGFSWDQPAKAARFRACAALMLAGLGILALSSQSMSYQVVRIVRMTGLGVWVAAAVAEGIHYLRCRRAS